MPCAFDELLWLLLHIFWLILQIFLHSWCDKASLTHVSGVQNLLSPSWSSLQNTRGRENRQITEALSVIIIITNMTVATLSCLLQIASTTATSLFTKQYSYRALLCLSRMLYVTPRSPAALLGDSEQRSAALSRSRRSIPHNPSAMSIRFYRHIHYMCTVFCIVPVLDSTCEWLNASQNF